MRRRSFLQGAATVSVLVVGGTVWRANDQGVFSSGQGPAYEPWKNWRTDSHDGPLALVRAAILAASPHNTQPWLFKVTPSSIELYLDTARNVGALDPYLREEHIGIGCALENLMLAAPPNGYSTTVTLLPGKLETIPTDPKPKLVASVAFAPSTQRQSNELFDAIPLRHTNRAPYHTELSVPPQFLDALTHLANDEPDVNIFLFTSESDRRKIVDISSPANIELYSDPSVSAGNEHWIRINWDSLQKHRDGLTVDAFGLPPIGTAIAKMVPAWMLARAASQGQKNDYANLMLTAPLIGILAVPDRYDQQNCLRAGRIWQRSHLLATARGLAGRPCNEAIEMIDHERAQGKPPKRATLLAEILGDNAWQPMFLFYMGYPTLTARLSPRRPIETVVI